MIQTFGYPSTGLAGAPWLPYHAGSHAWIAGLSKLTALSPFTLYYIAFPLIWYPLQIRAILSLAATVRQKFSNLPLQPFLALVSGFLLLAGIYFGVMPLALLGEGGAPMGMGLLSSESYSIAVTLSLLLLTLIAAHYPIGKERPAPFKNSVQTWLCWGLLLPLWIGLIAICKVSIAFLMMGLGGYWWLRLKGYKKPLFWFALLASIGLLLSIYPAITVPQHSEWKIFGDWKRFTLVDSRPYYIQLKLFWLLILTVLLGWHSQWKTFTDLKQAFLNRQTLLLESIWVVALLGLLVPNTMWLYSAATYFTDFQALLSVITLIALWPLLFKIPALMLPRFEGLNTLKQIPLAWGLLLVMLLPLIDTAWMNTKVYLGDTFPKIKGHLSHLHSKKWNSTMTPVLGMPLPLHANQLAQETQTTLQQLDQLYKLPVKTKQHTLVYVPREHPLWTKWSVADRCFMNSFLVPATTGMALLDGFPNPLCLNQRNRFFAETGYTFGYPKHYYQAIRKDKALKALGLQANHQYALSLKSPSSKALCQQAQKEGFKQVILLSTTPKTTASKWLLCHHNGVVIRDVQ